MSFQSVTALDALALESCTEVTAIATVFEVGKFCGATYAPVVLTVPSEEFPPLTPFTDQVTF
jgi:hypothetical protein